MFSISGFDVFGVYRESYAPVDSALEAIEWARREEGLIRVAVRRALYGEWDCDRFTIGGHVNHETGVLERY